MMSPNQNSGRIMAVIAVIFLLLSATLYIVGKNTDLSELAWRPRRPTRTPFATRTRIPTLTRTPIPPTSTPVPTSTFTPVPTDTPEPTFTDTALPPTPTSELLISVPISAVPVTGIPENEREAVSQQLLNSDVILIRSTSAQYFLFFPHQDARSLMFTINEDGYPGSLQTSIAAILSLADQYSVTTLSYNLEWPQHTLAEKVARLAAVRAELDAQGNTRPLVFGPIFNDFWTQYAAFAPYIEGYAVQLQRAEIGTEATLAAQSITKARSVLADPIMYFQISAQASGSFMRTPEQVIAAVQAMNELDGISYINLYFTEWWLPKQVLDFIRP